MNFFSKTSIMVVAFLLLTVSTTYAQTDSFDETDLRDLENEINEMLHEELHNYSTENVEFENPRIEVTQETLEMYDYNKQDILDAFREETELIKENAEITDMEFEENDTSDEEFISSDEEFMSTLSIIKNPSTSKAAYTASVSAVVPGLTTGSIRQDFNATVRSGYIKTISLRNNSYMSTAIGISSWSHIDSWTTIETVGAYQGLSASIRMKGTISYIMKGSPLKYTTTFKKQFTPSNLK